MTVTLTPELERIVEHKVRSGHYRSASEVVTEAIQLMEQRDQVKADIKQKIAMGLASARAGRLSDADTFFARMEAELEKEIDAEGARAELP